MASFHVLLSFTLLPNDLLGQDAFGRQLVNATNITVKIVGALCSYCSV